MGYTDISGLYVKYGTERATVNTAGEYKTYGSRHEAEVVITLTGLGTASAILSDTALIPKGARLEEVQIVNQTAATSGGSAVLNIGLIRTDRTTAYDADGLVAALALTAYDTAGEKVIINVGSTGAGALLGTTLANSGLLVADYDTAAFTAGVLKVRVIYYVA